MLWIKQSPRAQSRASPKAGASAIQSCKRRLLVKRTAKSKFLRPPAFVYQCGVGGGGQPVLFCESVSRMFAIYWHRHSVRDSFIMPFLKVACVWILFILPLRNH
jgi:hypothetical protein